ncbi:MAG: hypothetical protein GY737_32095, partial [Desulfobacteraceae bacterium]|nr:hypothetical protein [Desulfobacteraceae bacterium]
MKLTLGIDLGSTAIKLVFVNDGELIWKKVEPTAPQQEKIVRTMIQQGLDALSLTEDNIEKIHVTGYGKKLIANADKAVDEISANALGVYLLSGKKARSIINIGGQDVKYIKLAENGKVSDFRMNDKCAAGTGRFFEMAARILDTPITDFEA